MVFFFHYGNFCTTFLEVNLPSYLTKHPNCEDSLPFTEETLLKILEEDQNEYLFSRVYLEKKKKKGNGEKANYHGTYISLY